MRHPDHQILMAASTASATTIESAVAATIVIDGRRYLNFGGSSYLGLSANLEVLAAGAAVLQTCGSGVPLARDQGTITYSNQQVEREAAEFFAAPAAMFLASGYFFGLIALAILKQRFNSIFFDEFAHYSLREAIAASGLPNYSFRHLDAADLQARLSVHLTGGARPLIVTDGMYAAMGGIAPLRDLNGVAQTFNGQLLVDESHSFGVLGATGRGALEQHEIGVDDAINGGSLGKAFGTCGGIILGSEEDIAQSRRTPAGLGASSGMPAAAAMCAASLRYVREHPELLQRLRANTAALKSGLNSLGLQVDQSIAPVASFTAGAGQSMRELRQRLLAEGIFVYHTTYIGAGAGGVIRCGIFADHSPEQIDHLVQTLRRLI